MQIEITEEIGQVRILVPWSSTAIVGGLGCLSVGWVVLLAGGIWGLNEAMHAWDQGLLPFLLIGGAFFLAATIALYQTLCAQANRLEILISDEGTFTVKEYPWPKLSVGPLPVSKIKQFYIVEHYLQDKAYVSLFLQKSNGIRKRLVFLPKAQYPELRELEAIIEQRLGVSEQKIKGEFRPGSLGDTPAPRPTSHHAQVTGPQVQRLHTPLVTTLQLDHKTWDVAFTQQYDWEQGATSYLLHLKHGEETLEVYKNEFGQLFKSVSLGLKAQRDLGLAWQEEELSYHTNHVRLLEKRRGLAFRTYQQHQPGIPCEEYYFKDLDQRQIIRVVRYENMLEAYKDTRCE